MADDEIVERAFRVIGEALSIEPEDLRDHERWNFLGFNNLLIKAVAADLTSQGINVTEQDFETYANVGALKRFLLGEQPEISNAAQEAHADVVASAEDPWKGMPRPRVPISVVLQGTPRTSRVIVFLFPDGSGAGTAYNTLPALGEDICLVAMNSPFLRQAQNFTCSIERMAALWLAEVQRLQPSGRPYTIGGWSAGGYYAYEVAKLLSQANEKVERLILIDSPCRLEFAALPVNVIQHLTSKGLLGGRKPPEWMISHFISTVLSVEQYVPTPMENHQIPGNVDLIWCREGLVNSIHESGLDVDIGVNVTKFLLEPRGTLGSEHWDELMRESKYAFYYMTGHHFQVAEPPHCESLGAILRKILVG